MTLATQNARQVSVWRPQARRIPVLQTERLTLRAPCRADARVIAKFAGDRRIAENTSRIPHPYGIEDAEEYVASINTVDGETCFAVMRDDRLIGLCNVTPGKDGAEIGYWVGAPYWGQGIATEAARAMIDFAFADVGYDMLVAGARVSNPASRRVLEKCGFQWTGVGLYRIRAINSSAPIDRFRLDRGLWASLKAWGRAKEVA